MTETELICIVIHLLTGLFGQTMWDITIAGFSMKRIVVYPVASILLILCTYSYAGILMKTESQKRKDMLLQIATLIGLLAMEYVWMQLLIYESYNGIILLNFGIFLSLSICKIIVSSVTKVLLFFDADGTKTLQRGDDNLHRRHRANAAVPVPLQPTRTGHCVLDMLRSQPR